MARYFQAPVMQPADYGYEMPFVQKKAFMDQQQAMQDQGRSAVEGLYDVGQLNALKQDYGTRDKLINRRYEETDALLTDDEGNLKDLRNIKPAVTSIARRRAKEEQSGGAWNAINNNYAAAISYQNEIAELHKKGEIGIQRKDALISDAFSNYSGIGSKDEFGAFNGFSGKTAAKEVDDIQIAYDYAKDVAFQKLQAAGVIDQNGLLADNETIENVMNSSKFKSVMGGMYVQTGSVEFRTMETINNITKSALYSNNQLKEDIMQEAWQSGYSTPEQQAAYYEQKVNALSLNAAEKYASVKFSPQVKKNWMYEKQIDLKNGKALIDYEKAKELNTLEWNTTTQDYKIAKPQELNKQISAGTKRIGALKEKINHIKNKENPTGEELDNLHEYEVDLQKAELQNHAWERQQQAVGAGLIKTKGKGYGYGKATDAAFDLFLGGVSGTSANTSAEVKAFKAQTMEFLKNETELTEEEIVAKMMSGTLFNHEVSGKKVSDHILDIAKANDTKRAQPWLYRTTGNDSYNKVMKGDNYDMSGYFTKDVNSINNGGGFEISQNVTAQDAESGALRFFNKGLTQLVTDGSPDLTDVGTGGTFDALKLVQDLNGKRMGKVQAYDLKEPHPITGSPQALVVINYTDRNGKSQKIQRKVTTQNGTNTANSIWKNKRVFAGEKIKSAQARGSQPTAVADLEEGSLDYGYATLNGSRVQQMNNLKEGEIDMVIIPGQEDTPIFFKKTNAGKLKAGYGTPDGKGGWLEPDFVDNQGLIYDVRTWKQDGESLNHQWDNVEAFVQNYGWVAYNQELNQFYNPANRK